MIFNRKNLIILLIVVGALAIVGGVCAQENNDFGVLKTSNILKKVSSKNPKTVTVKLNKFKPGEFWDTKAVKFKNGDAIAGYVEYKGNSMYCKGTGVTAWYPGNGGNGDINPHHTKLVKAKFYFKNKAGKVKTKTVKGNGGGHIKTNLINGFTPYKAVVWYNSY